MSIQTAGEQKYYDFIEDKAKNLRTGAIVWISLLAAALIAALSNLLLGGVLAAAGMILAVMNIRSRKELSSKLDGIEDKAGFYNQLIAADTVEIPDYCLLITKDYVLSMKSQLSVLCLKEMAKVEVGIGQSGEKALFLTDKKGIRQELARTGQKDDEVFDRAYRALQERMKNH